MNKNLKANELSMEELEMISGGTVKLESFIELAKIAIQIILPQK